MALMDINNRRTKHYTYDLFLHSRANFYKNRASLLKQSHNAAMFVSEASRPVDGPKMFYWV